MTLCLVFGSAGMVMALVTLLLLGNHPLYLADYAIAFMCFISALLLNIHARLR